MSAKINKKRRGTREETQMEAHTKLPVLYRKRQRLNIRMDIGDSGCCVMFVYIHTWLCVCMWIKERGGKERRKSTVILSRYSIVVIKCSYTHTHHIPSHKISPSSLLLSLSLCLSLSVSVMYHYQSNNPSILKKMKLAQVVVVVCFPHVTNSDPTHGSKMEHH